MSELSTYANVVEAEAGPATVYDNLRDQFADTVPDVTALVLLSQDGLAKCGYGLDAADVDKVAAACSGLGSLGTGLSRVFGGGDVVHHNVSMKNAHAIITACGEGSSLVARITPDGALGQAVRETVRLAQAFGTQMGTDARAAEDAVQ